MHNGYLITQQLQALVELRNEYLDELKQIVAEREAFQAEREAWYDRREAVLKEHQAWYDRREAAFEQYQAWLREYADVFGELVKDCEKYAAVGDRIYDWLFGKTTHSKRVGNEVIKLTDAGLVLCETLEKLQPKLGCRFVLYQKMLRSFEQFKTDRKRLLEFSNAAKQLKQLGNGQLPAP